MQDAFEIGGQVIQPGTSEIVKIPLSRLSDHTLMSLTVKVLHGRKPGPVMFVSAAIHGDEIIGVEIIRRIAAMKQLKRLRGTLLLIPVVNAYGFNGFKRYLPDRRDLNRSFPGREAGSLAAQLAHAMMSQIVAPSDFGLDLHSAAVHRDNLPQIRADLTIDGVRELAEAFGAPITLDAKVRDGSLREAAEKVGCKMLLFEAGEALRFNEAAVRVGVKGVLRVMRHVGVLAPEKSPSSRRTTVFSQSSHWLRAPIGGLMRAKKKLGDTVRKGEAMAYISDPFGEVEEVVEAKADGIIIGRANMPVVNRGDALFHVARVGDIAQAEQSRDSIESDLISDPLFDDEFIV